MRKLQYLFMTLSVLFMAVPAFAQTSGEASTGHGLVAIAAGLGMGLAAGLCGLG
jgi:F-type H+-transporting ATPase subunit c